MTENRAGEQPRKLTEDIFEGGVTLAISAALLLFIGYISSVCYSRVLGVQLFDNDAPTLTAEGGLAVIRSVQMVFMPITDWNNFRSDFGNLYQVDGTMVYTLVFLTGFVLALFVILNLFKNFGKKILNLFAVVILILIIMLVYSQIQTLEFSEALNHHIKKDTEIYINNLNPIYAEEKIELAEILQTIVNSSRMHESAQQFGMGYDSGVRYVKYWVILVSSILLISACYLVLKLSDSKRTIRNILFAFVASQIAFLPATYGTYASNFNFSVGNALVEIDDDTTLNLERVYLLGSNDEYVIFYSRVNGFRTYLIPWFNLRKFDQLYRDSVFSNCSEGKEGFSFWPCEL